VDLTALYQTAAQCEVRVTGLKQNTVYRFRVSAVYEDIKSDFSQSSDPFRTAGDVGTSACLDQPFIKNTIRANVYDFTTFNTFVEPYYYVTTFITKICNCEIFQSYFSIFLPFLFFGPNLLMFNFTIFHSDVGVTHEAATFSRNHFS